MVEFILVPTDFSKNAWIALQYAANFAKETGAKLKVVHFFGQTEKTANGQMNTLLAQLKTEIPAIDCIGVCKRGNFNEGFIQMLKDEPCNLIIMGTKGASGLKYIIMGSNTLNMINQLSIPVLAVPENTVYHTINKVGLLSNYKNAEIDVMKKSIEVLPSPFILTLLHVRENENEDEKLILHTWKEVVKDQTNLKNIESKIGIGYGSEIPLIVNSMIAENKINLLIATNNGKSFFKTLFNRDLIKAIALRLEIPVLFIKA